MEIWCAMESAARTRAGGRAGGPRRSREKLTVERRGTIDPHPPPSGIKRVLCERSTAFDPRKGRAGSFRPILLHC